MKKLAFLFLVLIALVSCEEDNDLTVTINESGSLKVQVFDFSEGAYGGAYVNLVSFNGNNSYVIHTDSTNNNGVCTIKDVLQADYRLDVETKDSENRLYAETKLIQVVAGKEKTVEMNPFKISGEVILEFKDSNDEPYAGLNVALIPTRYYDPGNMTHEEFLEGAYYTGVTNGGGQLSFENVPYKKLNSVHYYTVYVYLDEDEASYYSNHFSVNTQGSVTRTYTVNLGK